MNRRWTYYAAIVGGAAFAGSVLTIELYFANRATRMPANWVDIAIPQFGRAAMWAMLAPLILRLREKMPLRRGRVAGGVGFHLAMSFVVMATFYVGRMWSYSLLFPEPSWRGMFWDVVWSGFHGHNLIDMAYYWAVIGFGHTLELHHKFKNEELKAAQLETRLVETELKALRQQMHPHFLFNTLNTIAVLVREGRHNDAVNLIARLSSLLRMSLDNTGVPEVTLQQELDFLGHYIEIQKTRFSDRLTVAMDVAPDTLRGRIPNLLLQPLVENAILHGVAPKTGPGRVDVTARVCGDRLELEVRDDGPGIVNGGQRTKEGVGLANTRERLAKLYGPKSQLLLHSEPGRGVSVKVTLPYRT